MRECSVFSLLFFFNDTATTEIYTLSLHDALPIYIDGPRKVVRCPPLRMPRVDRHGKRARSALVDRKSTRLNSSHITISYAVFCLKKKKKKKQKTETRKVKKSKTTQQNRAGEIIRK